MTGNVHLRTDHRFALNDVMSVRHVRERREGGRVESHSEE